MDSLLNSELVKFLSERDYVDESLQHTYEIIDGRWYVMSGPHPLWGLSLNHVIQRVNANELTDMIFVLAGTQLQAEHCIRELGINPQKAAYLITNRQVSGRANLTVIQCGTPYERREFSDIMEFIESRGAAIYRV